MMRPDTEILPCTDCSNAIFNESKTDYYRDSKQQDNLSFICHFSQLTQNYYGFIGF